MTETEILNYINDENNNQLLARKNYLKNNYPFILDYINKKIVSDIPINQKIYLIRKKLSTPPLCKNPNCNKIVKYVSPKYGYKTYCSNKCSTLDPETQVKLKSTMKKKYGVEHNSQLEQHGEAMRKMYKEKGDDIVAKRRKTNKERFGEEEYMSTDKFKDATKETFQEKYGSDYYMGTEDFYEKVKKTVQEKYGVDNVLQSDEIIERIKITMDEKYGTSGSLGRKGIVEKGLATKKELYGDNYEKIIEKILATKEERYGTNGSLEKKIIFEKAKKTLKKKTGYEYAMQIPEIKKKSLNVKNEKWRKKFKDEFPHLNIISITNTNDNIKILCPNCNSIYETYDTLIRGRNMYNIEQCTICHPKNDNFRSYAEKQLYNFIHDEITTEIIPNCRNIIPYELDIYLPKHNIAFEYNGLIFHSELYGKEKKYHLNKTIECNKQNIQLIHIWEDEWINKLNIVKSRIRNLFGISNKIYARKCIIKKVENDIERKFLNENHLQGYVASSIKIGLYYNNELSAIMTFGNNRFGKNVHQDGHYELLRFANKLNTQIIGGASKLMSYFIKNYNVTNIISFADRCWTIEDKNLYKSLGFVFKGYTELNYWYVINKKKIHRMNFTKEKLKEKGYINTDNSHLTEREILANNGIYRLWGCGNLKYEMCVNKKSRI